MRHLEREERVKLLWQDCGHPEEVCKVEATRRLVERHSYIEPHQQRFELAVEEHEKRSQHKRLHKEVANRNAKRPERRRVFVLVFDAWMIHLEVDFGLRTRARVSERNVRDMLFTSKKKKRKKKREKEKHRHNSSQQQNNNQNECVLTPSHHKQNRRQPSDRQTHVESTTEQTGCWRRTTTSREGTLFVYYQPY